MGSQNAISLGNGQSVYVDEGGGIMVGANGSFTSQGSITGQLGDASNSLMGGIQSFTSWMSNHPILSALIGAAATAMGIGPVWTSVSLAAKAINFLSKHFGQNKAQTSSTTQASSSPPISQGVTTGADFGSFGSINPTVNVGDLQTVDTPISTGGDFAANYASNLSGTSVFSGNDAGITGLDSGGYTAMDF